MSNVKVKALRQIWHEGQKWKGDEFEMPKSDAQPLVDSGALEFVSEKAEKAAPKNKAEGASPKNKAAE